MKRQKKRRKKTQQQSSLPTLNLSLPSLPKVDLISYKREKKGGKRISKADIRKLWEKQKGRCARCKKKLNPLAYHIDHKVPKALGGSDSIRNLQLLCPECHMLKTQEDRKKISRKKKRRSD